MHLNMAEDSMWQRVCLLLMLTLLAGTPLAAQTIVGVEVQSYFYSGGVMKQSDPQFEITYVREGDVISRIMVYDRSNKRATPDDTKYQVQAHLATHPIGPGDKTRYGDPPVIRAIGQPGTDAIELLVITKDFIHSYKSTADYLVISRLKRVK